MSEILTLDIGVVSVMRKQMFIQAANRDEAANNQIAETLEDEIS